MVLGAIRTRRRALASSAKRGEATASNTLLTALSESRRDHPVSILAIDSWMRQRTKRQRTALCSSSDARTISIYGFHDYTRSQLDVKPAIDWRCSSEFASLCDSRSRPSIHFGNLARALLVTRAFGPDLEAILLTHIHLDHAGATGSRFAKSQFARLRA
jgi:hypothetical protein